MNDELTKIISKKEKLKNRKNSKFYQWLYKNNLKIERVILFPIHISAVIYNKVNGYLDSRTLWNEKRAEELLRYYIPRKAQWNEENKELYIFNNSLGWSLYSAKKYLRRKDYRFFRLHRHEIATFLVNRFELDGFSKEAEYCFGDGDGMEIVFTLKG